MDKLKTIVFLVLVGIFIYLRLGPILNQTVPYTYDQGRDFLKAQEMIKDKHLTFIGPTTGIQGVFHGAWWYYFLAPLYLIFNGWPQGYYLGLFFINLIVNLWFFRFLKRDYGFLTAIFFLGLVSVSEFFINTSFYASNNTLAPLFVLTLIFALYQYFDKKNPYYAFMIGLSLGFILETELAFGLFLIPAFVIVYLLFKKLKDFPYFLIGLIVPSIPRLLFEAKNNFLQTRSLITQLTSAKETHPLQFSAAVVERTRSFWQYWTGIFYHQELFISVAFLVFLVIAIFFIKKSSTTKKTLFAFLAILLVIVYAFSILYKNNFFWSYYLDGIQYIFLFLLVSGFHFLEKNKKTTWLPVGCLIIVIGINLFVFFKNATNKNKVPLLGLRADNQIINYLVDASKHQYFCLNIYTPPVIPYTYMYLLSYYADQGKIIYPKEDFVNNQCYFLIDQDEYQFRVDQWREKNIPAEAEKEKTIKFQNGSVIELWTKK